MHIKKVCKVCSTPFIAKRENQRFCKRRCFRIDYSRRTREANSIKKFPSYICPACGHKHELDYSPAKEQKRWEAFICTKCKISNDKMLEINKEQNGVSTVI